MGSTGPCQQPKKSIHSWITLHSQRDLNRYHRFSTIDLIDRDTSGSHTVHMILLIDYQWGISYCLGRFSFAGRGTPVSPESSLVILRLLKATTIREKAQPTPATVDTSQVSTLMTPAMLSTTIMLMTSSTLIDSKVRPPSIALIIVPSAYKRKLDGIKPRQAIEQYRHQNLGKL